MLTLLGGLAKFDRELIRSRASEGWERAKARGVHMGRPSALTRHQREEVLARHRQGQGDASRHRAAVQCEQKYDFAVVCCCLINVRAPEEE
jgi:DNA invertase Pin-like site-specific DNA recombinase